MGVIDRFEVIEVDEQHRELVSEARRAVDLRLECLIKMTRIEEAGAIVGDRQFLNLLDRPRILNRNCRVVAECLQKEFLLVREVLHVHVDELDHAQYAQL